MSSAGSMKQLTIRESIGQFTAVDITTIAVLAVLFRVSMFGYRLTMAAFPYNIGIRFFFDVLLACLVVGIVQKRGALAAYAVTWWLINFAVEGEDLVWLFAFWIPIVAAEWYLSRTPNGYAGITPKRMVVGVGVLYGCLLAVIYWIYLPVYYQLEYAPGVIATSLGIIVALCLVASIVGGIFANRLRDVLN
jgi:hypothetical protein